MEFILSIVLSPHEDASRNSSEKQTFKGLAMKLASSSFVINLATMYDCLEELSGLSLDLQDRKIALPRAHALIYRAIRVFHSMVDYPGIKYKEVKCVLDKVGRDRKFKDVLIKDNRKSDVVIPYGQLMRSLAANLEKRDELPQPGTLVRMCSELMGLACQQVAEELGKATDLTLHSDGTSKYGQHWIVSNICRIF